MYNEDICYKYKYKSCQRKSYIKKLFLLSSACQHYMAGWYNGVRKRELKDFYFFKNNVVINQRNFFLNMGNKCDATYIGLL